MMNDAPCILVVKWDRFSAMTIRRCAEAAYPGVRVVSCHTAVDAIAQVRAYPAWLGIIGLTLRDVDGLDLLAEIVATRSVRRLMVISGRSDEQTTHVLRAARIHGFFDSGRDYPEALVKAIRAVGDGGVYFSPSFRASPKPPQQPPLHATLTAAELQVFAMIGDGSDDQAVAERLGVSPHTIRTHRQRIMWKLGKQTRGTLCLEAIRRGVVRIGGDGRILRPGFGHIRTE